MVWLSPLVHVVDNEETTDLQRLAMVVDCANGVGAALDPQQFMFMNTDTVVHLHRLPTGTDFALRARGSIGPDGVGVTTAEILTAKGSSEPRRRRCWCSVHRTVRAARP